jgi:hypothetical protein
MKKTLKYFLVLAALVGIYTGCKRDEDYHFEYNTSGFITNFDLKKLFKESELSLNTEALSGAYMVKGIVISDFRSGNSSAGLLILQNSRPAGSGIDSLRGMSFNIGASAANFVPGDSVHIKLEGGTLRRVNGILQVAGLSGTSVTKMASGRQVKMQAVSTGAILTNPDRYESTLVTLTNAAYEPELALGTTFSGNHEINDGFGVATIHTEATATFAGDVALPSGNFSGIPFISGTGASKKITFWMRTLDDFFYVPKPKLSPAVISGYMVDPNGSDQPYEYIQFLATKDINFAVTPMSVYTTNNAGATTFPTLGWNTGGVRTYKINLTSGTVTKGEFFYVGGSGKRINGSASTSMSSSKWIAAVDYSTATGSVGANGIGDKTNNLLANSGNVAGIAIFDGTNVTPASIPLDVIMFGGAGGNFYSAGPPEVGYRITITDYYGTVNPATRLSQDFYGAGTNTRRLAYPSAATAFSKLGGVYNATKGGWVTGRLLTTVPLVNSSVLSEIETGGVTTLSN